MTLLFDFKSSDERINTLAESIQSKLKLIIGKDPIIATEHDWLNATSYAVRDLIVERWLRSVRASLSQSDRRVSYLSMEFLIGRTLSNTLLNLEIYDDVSQALNKIGVDLEKLVNEEDDPGLGNGGLGRLAACFLDSLATLKIPATGYGIRYEYGMFKQNIVDGQQTESPDNWLEYGNAWEFPRTNLRYKVQFGGRIQKEGNTSRWINTEEILACAYDQIVMGYGSDATNTLRLWSARTNNEMNLGKFNKGDYIGAVKDKNFSENISRILYPNDATSSGKKLRLGQEYFLVSATLQNILHTHYRVYNTYDNLVDKVAIHLNDTHPVLAIPELMRLLIDEHGYSWSKSWEMTEKIFSYTNHTLMSEALETWPVEMMGDILPRHLEIIFEINDHFLRIVKEKFPNDHELLTRVSLIDEKHGRQIRMAWLAVVGCYKINGVSELHSELMVQNLFSDFSKIFPNRFCNVTNGITPRRWLALSNKPLSYLLDESIGKTWRNDLGVISEINNHACYPSFIERIKECKLENKKKLALYIAENLNIIINPNSLFDVQIKRIHEYKRQLLNLLQVINRYNRILQSPNDDWVPRVVIFSGKAASSYVTAKTIIHLINDVANVINNDQRIKNKLKVVFIPNYSVSLAQLIIPAADLSEQISLAGTEASGTGNMKFALNGALTIGTLDGANIEIKEHVGTDNIFIFGNTAEEVEEIRLQGYEPRKIYENDHEVNQVLNQIASGFFNSEEPERYRALYDSLINFGDYYQLLADFRSYVDTQDDVDALYKQPELWAQKSVSNIANMGYFSSDRTIDEYARDIWKVKPTIL
ncbi:starch phosphorylase [Providencia alcalifaciens]|nr:starch phosphorylase [Providencia alcalifaciens]